MNGVKTRPWQLPRHIRTLPMLRAGVLWYARDLPLYNTKYVIYNVPATFLATLLKGITQTPRDSSLHPIDHCSSYIYS